jgi:plastocyanin
MQTSNFGPNQNVPVITPPVVPRKRRMARWLTLAALVLFVGGGSVLWLVRDNSTVVEAAPSATVEITRDGFVPQTIKVKKGQTIVWVNADTAPHQVASDPYPTNEALPILNSEEPLAEGESFAAVLEEAGIFTYHDELNPMGPRATIIVEEN